MKKLLLIATCALSLAACTNAPQAQRALAAAGFKDVHTYGYGVWGCDKDDWTNTAFDGIGADGQPVKGRVCQGWFKGATIRTF